MNVVGLDSPDHIPHQRLAAHINTPNGANVAEGVQDAWLTLGTGTTQESDHADNSLKLDALEALSEGPAATHFDDIIHTSTLGSQLASSLAPVGVVLVVDNVVGSELLELLTLFGR